jgi:predicted dehydrogenase
MEMPTPKLRVALLGAGFMGRAHSNAYQQVSRFFDVPYDVERRVLCGRDPVKTEAMAGRWGWSEWSTDWRATIERNDIDLVDVALPNSLHAEAAILAAQAGKMVLVEKPMALTSAEAERVVAAAHGVPNLVWFNYRRVPAIAYARQLIDEGRIGQVFHYRAVYLQEWGNDPTRPPSWKTSRAMAGAGVVLDLLSHSIDTALYLNGPLGEVSAFTHTFKEGREVEDAVLVQGRFANGALCSFEATRYGVGCRNRNQFEIHGSRGMLRFNLEEMNTLEYLDATEAANLQGLRKMLVTGPNHPYSANFWKPAHIIGYEHTFIATLADFLTATATGAEFHPTLADGLAVQQTLDRILAAAAH